MSLHVAKMMTYEVGLLLVVNKVSDIFNCSAVPIDVQQKLSKERSFIYSKTPAMVAVSF